jgi:hypothetical protein
MKMKQQSITNLPPSPDAERHGRMIKYAVMMLIRVICIIVVLLVPGWWRLIPALGAIFLPYFAVVVANVASGSSQAVVERPGNIVPVGEGPVPPKEPGAEGARSAERDD